MQFVAILSGAGTNLGVGHTSGACVEKCFFLLCPPPLLPPHIQLVV